MAEDYYDLLEVPRNASEDQIKKSYRRLARELHPDANGGDAVSEERFKLVTVAYETLGDPERRRRYDTYGPEGARGSGAGGPGAGGFEDVFGAGLGDLFSSFFGAGAFGGGGNQGRGPRRGPDMETTLGLEFRAAVFGSSNEVRLRVPVPCETCSATGAASGTSASSCTTCGGAGEVRKVRQSILGQMVTAHPCPRCGGMGQVIATPCNDCRGEGRRTEERSYTVDVPAGVKDGTTLKVTGRGGAGPRGAPAGDLYVHLRVKTDDRYERQGNDLVHVFSVPLVQAALGAHIRYDTLDGTEDLIIPRATQSGRIFRLRGRGVPDVSGRGRGDLLIQVAVETPGDLTKEQEDLLRGLAAARGEEVAPPDTGFMARVRSAFK